MSKELNNLFHELLQEIAEQEKKMTVSASEEAMRRAEEIVQDVEEDKSWQIPPEPKKPEIPPPQHDPVVVPPPISHFTDEPSQNPAVRMRDRLDETALPKPDVERKPTQIFETRPKKNMKKKKRRKKTVQSRPSGRRADMPTPTETKRKVPHIHIPDELPPDIPGEPAREMSVPVQKKAGTSPRDEMVRSRAELIREQLRRAAEEEVRHTEQTDTIQEVLTDEETLPDTAPAVSDVPDMSREKQGEEPIKKPSAFKRFLNVFLDLDSDDEEEAETDEDDAWDVPEEDAWDEPEDIEDKEDVDEDVQNTVPFRKSETDKPQPSLRNLTDIPEQEVRPSLLNRFRQKRKKAVKKDSDQDEESTPQKTDWRTLVAPPSPEIPETAVSDDDDFYTDDLYEHRQFDVERTAKIAEEAKAIVRNTLSDELPDIAAPPMPPPATPKAPDPETPAAPAPATPEIPAPETPSVPEPTAPSLTELSVRQRRVRRLRNLEMFEDEPAQMYIPDELEETAGTPQDVQEETKSEKRPAPSGIAAVLREALDESAEELAEMKAEPLPGKSDGGVKTRFLKRHWYFLAGILCFLLALVGMMTCISWGIDKAKRFVGSSSIKQSIEDVLYPVAVVDLPAFETPGELNAGDLLSAAMVDILMYDDLSAYPVNFDVISIPANDVLARAQQRFGTEFSVEFATLYAAGETFYYDAASGCYNVTTSPTIFSYAPEVTKLQRNGDTYTASVLCVSDKASWQKHSENFKGGSEKMIEVTLQKNGDSYQIQRIVSVG